MAQLGMHFSLRKDSVEVLLSLLQVPAGLDGDDFDCEYFPIALALDLAHLREATGAQKAQVLEVGLKVLNEREVHRFWLSSRNQSLASVINIDYSSTCTTITLSALHLYHTEENHSESSPPAPVFSSCPMPSRTGTLSISSLRPSPEHCTPTLTFPFRPSPFLL